MEIGSDRSLFILQGDRPFYSIKVDRLLQDAKSTRERSYPVGNRPSPVKK